MEKQNKEGSWVYSKKQYKFFKEFTPEKKTYGRGYYGDRRRSQALNEKVHKMLEHIDAEPKFRKLLKNCLEGNPKCRSLSTFFSRLEHYFIYEAYIMEEINYSLVRPWDNTVVHLKHYLHEYDKISLKLLKELNYKIDRGFEKFFFDENSRYIGGEEVKNGFYTPYIKKIMHYIYHYDVTNEKKEKLLNVLMNRTDDIYKMTEEYKYDLKAMMNYVVEYLQPFENLSYSEGFVLLKDYYGMGHRIGRKLKKYPKYLKSMHDIIKANYEAFKKDYPEQLFAQLQKPELEYEGKEFCIVIPKSSKDIIDEGVQLNHCVSSYVDRILERKCILVFLRKKEKPEEGLVTVEIKEQRIVQARGSYNRNLEKEELEFLQAYAKKMEMVVSI